MPRGKVAPRRVEHPDAPLWTASLQALRRHPERRLSQAEEGDLVSAELRKFTIKPAPTGPWMHREEHGE